MDQKRKGRRSGIQKDRKKEGLGKWEGDRERVVNNNKPTNETTAVRSASVQDSPVEKTRWVGLAAFWLVRCASVVVDSKGVPFDQEVKSESTVQRESM